ncbi:hypothetical protein [Microbacterium sp. SORGH_AS_0421]|uniref:hypothetical protein n=1 Tax=Microbacterium sp. SORGH_AS_0421 TaxID=3041768 RepID=UPI00278DA02C|nr:hypothetical protein [Microbacterium sp. SORGH_AS_0421]MDQ1177117.1 hypothetical protein [Microbacterium sp. SORGH_AS_0421]
MTDPRVRVNVHDPPSSTTSGSIPEASILSPTTSRVMNTTLVPVPPSVPMDADGSGTGVAESVGSAVGPVVGETLDVSEGSGLGEPVLTAPGTAVAHPARTTAASITPLYEAMLRVRTDDLDMTSG